jgi:hypothetical protein
MAKAKPKTKQIVALDPTGGEGKLKRIGGSQSDGFNHILAIKPSRRSGPSTRTTKPGTSEAPASRPSA